MQFTDTHCHLDFIELNQHMPALFSQCQNQNIHRIIVPGITAKRWPRVLSVCEQSSQLFPALGLHPWWINKATEADLALLEDYLKSQKLIALGEIGIDGGIDNIEKQSHYFVEQLKLADKYQLPTLIHHRKSHQHILPILKQLRPAKGGIIHAFSGSYQQAIQYIDLGFKLGIGGTITYERAKKTINAVKRLPLESLVLETDAPAMPIDGFQGQDNSPLRLTNVFQCLSRIRSEPAEQLAEQIEYNVNQLLFQG